MSAAWKGLCRGGCKVRKRPCHCCGVYSDDLAHPNPSQFVRFCVALHANKPEGFRCYHRPIITDDILEGMQVEVDKLIASMDMQVQDLQAVGNLTHEDPFSFDSRENAKLNPA